MDRVILIPARMQSTRLPEKPLADIAGKPMIAHVLARALEADIAPVYVACDDLMIKEAVERAGGRAVMTSSSHASGSDRIFEALTAIDPDKNFSIVVNLQGDIPTLEPRLVRSVLEPLEDKTIDISTLACPIKDPAEISDPSVVKPVLSFSLRRADVARALYFSRATVPHGEGTHYHHIGIYAYRRAALERFVSLPPSPLELREKLEQLRALEAGMHIGVAVVDTVPLGVDTPEHLERARRLL